MHARTPAPRAATAVARALLILPLSTGAVHAADEPRAWLERMNQAVDLINYEGTMVHFLGGDTDVLQVVQRVEGDHVTERISSEDAGREIIRDDGAVTLYFGDQRAVAPGPSEQPRSAADALRGRLKRAARVNDAYYHVVFAGSERIAGRDARLVVIRPKDRYRYGYRLWLDRPTAMPLKTQLLSGDGALLEQILFTRIALNERIPDGALRPSRPWKGASSPQAAKAPPPPSVSSKWEAARVPPGFTLMVQHERAPSLSARAMHHLVYSDGLATVSLFVEPAVAAAEQAEGLCQVGAANAYITTVDGYMVTAIGEAPVETVEMLARSARPLVAPDHQ